MATSEAPQGPRFMALTDQEVLELATEHLFARTINPGLAAWLAKMLSGEIFMPNLIFLPAKAPVGSFYCRDINPLAITPNHPGGFTLYDSSRFYEVRALLGSRTSPGCNTWQDTIAPRWSEV